jgi:pyrroloquinoline-quinone synthase
MRPDQLRDALATVLDGRRLLEHPFYRRWAEGEVSLDELRAYAAQYRHVEAAMPGILQAVVDRESGTAVGTQVARTLADETGVDGAPSHLELFDGFVAALGAAEAPATPATARLVEVLGELAADSTPAGLAGLAAYELQSPEVSASKAGGLRRHYGLDGTAVAFWDTHAVADFDHAEWMLEALAATGVDAGAVSDAAAAAADAWWAFLDEREADRP